jgi:heat shock protein HtpX
LLIDLPYSTILAAIVALVPAALRWWWGRALAPLVEDPAFPERLVAHRHRTARSFAVSCALLFVLFTRTAVWSLPLLAFTCIGASFRFRRAIYQESWGLVAYLSFIVRLIVAIFGFWLLLAGVPAIASLAGSRDWLAALLLTAALWCWNAHYTDVVRFLMRSRPVSDPVLAARFVALAQASSAGMPRFERVDLRGGSIANAIALPSLNRAAVLFTDTLLSRLEENESVAICAHELAHLEYYNPARLRHMNVGNVLLIAGSVLTVATTHVLDPWISLSILWPCVVVVTMGWRARHRQLHETESDLRAVALTGDAAGLASALTKLHAYAHVPRRVDAELEQHASHPSLARRIKAIRAMAPAAPAAATLQAAFVADDGRAQVTFGSDRLEWREGNAALHSLTYACLTELRVQAPASGLPRLLVVERGGRRWEMVLAGGDVGRAQGVLDLIDGQLAEPTPVVLATPAAQRLVTFIAISASVLSGQIATIIVGLIAMMRPSAPLLAAAGAAMVAAAGLSLRQPDWAGLDLELLPVPLLAIGSFLVWSAWTTRHDEPHRNTARLVATLGILGLIELGAVFAGGTDVVHAHRSARMLPGAVVWPVAFGAALTWYPAATARAGAAASFVVALAVAIVGSIPFLDRFGDDPFLLESPAMDETSLAAVPATELVLPFYAMDVQLSPGATHVAARDMRGIRGRRGELSSFQVGRPGRQFTSVAADSVFFLDDERLLTVREGDEGTEIDERLLTRLEAPVWRQVVPGLFGARLVADGVSRGWRLVGWDADGRIVRVRGAFGTSEVETARWAAPKIDRHLGTMAVAVSEHHAIVVETQYDYGSLDILSARMLAVMLDPGATNARLWHVDEHGPKDLGLSRITTTCSPDVMPHARLVCSAYDGTRTRIVTLDATTGVRAALGVMNGRFAVDEHPPAGWLTGWRDMTPVAIRLRTGQIVTAPHEHALIGFAAADRWLATVTVDGEQSTLRLYPLPSRD